MTTGLAATTSPRTPTASSASSLTRVGANPARRWLNQTDAAGTAALTTMAGTIGQPSVRSQTAHSPASAPAPAMPAPLQPGRTS